MNKKNRKIVSLSIITLLSTLLGLLFLSPFYIIIVNAFKTKQELFKNTLSLPITYTLDNFKEAFNELDFGNSLFHSLFITITSVVLIIIFSSMAAWMLERTKSKISNILLMMFLASMIIPFQAVMLPLIRFMGKLNLLNVGGIIFMYIGFGASMSIFLYHGFLKSIPKELDEAAMIDGCNKFQIFWYIIFPLLKPISVTVAILNTVWIWNDYLLPSLVINKPTTLTIPLKTFFFFGEYTKQWNLALSGLILDIIPVIVFYFFAQKQIIKSVTAGSIK
ncbi:raffinose/stachyose/melibiose transport system permease protein [Clostridium acidisoli DSM 12555]|uniref:Raffinose/stachyose/melibiose transport system permease protein n=1 Tax=Clostridium acidisoli DSM 12555 TaxID=1121291 RepID=A0A1W1XM49_9CLOT|nr:carbohydrate ABC transporter permease [Clostridium acidisoli]SMC24996.1 raffinose/stachyose/melibiose transport system permease protein [Clostridium acidisoli DSM 12555]